MNPVEEMLERIKRLRNGEDVTCKRCKEGVMVPIGDYKTSDCFVCNKCKNKLIIN